MKVVLLAIGKTDSSWVKEGIEVYSRRIIHYHPFEMQLIPDIKNSKNLSQDQQKEKEGELILKYIQPNDILVLLDERGKELSSSELAGFLNSQFNLSARQMIFVIGGPYGFSEQVYKRANQKISLSKLTFSHQLVRVVFLEQLYRANTILKGEPYHHE